MEFMTMRDSSSGAKPIAQRRAEQICFHVMRSQRIPTKQYMNKSLFNQPGEGLSTAGMNDRRSSCQQDFGIRLSMSMPFSQLPHPSRDIGDDMAVGPFCRYLRFHEPEYIPLLRTLQWYDTHSLSTNHDLITT